MQIAQIFAGFSLGAADILRRAIGKKIIEELKSQRAKFIEGAKGLGHTEKTAIIDALRETSSKSAASKLLKIPRSTLYFKMDKYKLHSCQKVDNASKT